MYRSKRSRYGSYKRVASRSRVARRLAGVRASDVRVNGYARSVKIEHTEYISNWQLSQKPVNNPLLAGGNANTEPGVFVLNPCNIAIFPWLAQIASNFQQFEFQRLEFMFTTTSVDALNSVNTALGYCAMACEYNLLQPTPGTRAGIENLDGCVTFKPSVSATFRVNCRPTTLVIPEMFTDFKPYFQVGPPLIPTSGANLAALGNLILVSGAGQADNIVVGELRVHYVIKLRRPILPTADLTSLISSIKGQAVHMVGGAANASSISQPNDPQQWTLNNAYPDQLQEILNDITIEGGTSSGDILPGYIPGFSPVTGQPAFQIGRSPHQFAVDMSVLNPALWGTDGPSIYTGITNTAPLGQYASHLNDTAASFVTPTPPHVHAAVFASSGASTATGFDEIVLFPAINGRPLSAQITLTWTGLVILVLLYACIGRTYDYDASPPHVKVPSFKQVE